MIIAYRHCPAAETHVLRLSGTMPRISNKKRKLVQVIQQNRPQNHIKEDELVNHHKDEVPEAVYIAQPNSRKKRKADHCASMRAKKRQLRETSEIDHEVLDSSPKTAPLLRSASSYKKVQHIDESYIVNVRVLTDQLQQCEHCDKGPLNLANICHDVKKNGPVPILRVKCSYCERVNVLRPAPTHRTGERGPGTLDINSQSGLGAIHTGIGHAHYKGLLSTLGLPALTSRNFKEREREAGYSVEAVTKASCVASTEKEKLLSAKNTEEDPDIVEVGVSYDMGWRKRGKKYDSPSGVGTAVGIKTGKVISYSTRNKLCRVCQEASRRNKKASPHDCRQNHEGSSKSMESNVAVELFTNATNQGASYTTYVGDDDSTTESRLETLVSYNIEKWSDINHASRTLGSRMYAVKAKVKGLNPAIISYFQRNFTYSIKQNKGDPKSLKESLSSIVPHAFGQHDACKEWCKYKENPKNFRHGDLPGGRDLEGEDLRACIEDAFSPFLTEEAAKKLAPAGSSQRNECINSIIGTKAPKIRHYGGSLSSDFRTAAGVAQFNEGYSYLDDSATKMGVANNPQLNMYVGLMDKKRKQDRKRKSTKAFKKARRSAKKKKTLKTRTAEEKEGVTYKSGVGLTQTEEDRVAITNGTLNDLRTSLKDEEYHRCIQIASLDDFAIQENDSTTPRGPFKLVVFDIETTGLSADSEIIQIACTVEGKQPFNEFLLPEKKLISNSATKIHGISVNYKNGKKQLERNREVIPTVSQKKGLNDFCRYLQAIHCDLNIILAAHNGNRFDFPILIRSLKDEDLLDSFLGQNIWLLDSLSVISTEVKLPSSPLKNCKGKSLQVVFNVLFGEQFNAHDAREDVLALSRILNSGRLVQTQSQMVALANGSGSFLKELERRSQAQKKKLTINALPISNGMKDKISNAGLDMGRLTALYRDGGARALLIVLALSSNGPSKARDVKEKPRVTKKLSVLTDITRHFAGAAF